MAVIGTTRTLIGSSEGERRRKRLERDRDGQRDMKILTGNSE
jgi:hypothetical protein